MKQNLRIAIAYPPIESPKGTALLAQNRQFQYFNAPTYVYPMVPAYAASLLQARGYAVKWIDGIAEQWSYARFCEEIARAQPDLMIMETKTPVIRRHWAIVADLKQRFPEMLIAMFGDHVSWNPQETFTNCPVDYILAGGDYDFLALSLVNHLSRDADLEGGIWWREKNQSTVNSHQSTVGGVIRNSGIQDMKNHRLDDLPMVDRELTRWKLYAYENGNFKYTPGTYTYAGRDCWWGRCTFCVWEFNLYPQGSYRIHSAERMLNEVESLISLGVREIFDDTGTLPAGAWLKKFCNGMIERGYNKQLRFGHNMRFNLLNQEQYDLMGKAGFRFILYGLESANQKTLDKLDKGVLANKIEEELRWAKGAGLAPHLTVMIGYPWETAEDSQRTVDFVHDMFAKGLVDTLQGTIVVPYPGTPLYYECKEKGWLKSEDWDRYDMRASVMQNPINDEQIRGYVQQLYRAFMSPQFIARKALSIRDLEDVKFLATAGMKVAGHLMDFKKKQAAESRVAG
ncbi:MAG: B12-binding domain-containing radical SAM protein [Chloroflexi bacterium]|nr:B12-binding domain-containing radical SAM protein [Chloroflexota bacterium]